MVLASMPRFVANRAAVERRAISRASRPRLGGANRLRSSSRLAESWLRVRSACRTSPSDFPILIAPVTVTEQREWIRQVPATAALQCGGRLPRRTSRANVTSPAACSPASTHTTLFGTIGSRTSCCRMTSPHRPLSKPRLRAALLAVVLAFAWLSPSAAVPPNLVPPGWKHEAGSPNRRVIRFTSPDGRATLTMRDISAGGVSPAAKIGTGPGDQVTYQRRGQSWWVVSGYRGEDIFYRRAGYACGRRRIHLIELIYPRDQKRQFDAVVTSISHRLESYRGVCPKR